MAKKINERFDHLLGTMPPLARDDAEKRFDERRVRI